MDAGPHRDLGPVVTGARRPDARRVDPGQRPSGLTGSGTRVGPRPAALVPPGALSRPAAAAHRLRLLRVPAGLRLDVLPADVREANQPGLVQRQPADRLVAPALPRVDLPGGIADAVVGVGPLARGRDRRVAHSHGRPLPTGRHRHHGGSLSPGSAPAGSRRPPTAPTPRPPGTSAAPRARRPAGRPWRGPGPPAPRPPAAPG